MVSFNNDVTRTFKLNIHKEGENLYNVILFGNKVIWSLRDILKAFFTEILILKGKYLKI